MAKPFASLKSEPSMAKGFAIYFSKLFTRWIDVKKKLPARAKKVLVCGTPIGITTAYFWGIGDSNCPSDPCNGWSIMNVTHWRKLPIEPKKRK